MTVLDPAGRPVAGALVTALPVVGAYDGIELRVEKLRSAISDPDGHARLDRMPAGPWTVTVRAHGFRPAREARVDVATLTVRLDSGGTIAGFVLDGATKAPVAGARVSIPDGAPLPGDWQQDVGRNEAVSNARGAFRLEGVGRGPVAVVARAKGYGPATRNNARAGGRIDLYLFPGPTLSGTVRDDAGNPVPGASLRLFAQGWSLPPPVDATDAKGRFVAPGATPGEYWIVARSGGRAPGFARVVITERDDAAVDVTLGEGGYVTGRTVDASEAPIAGARVEPEAFGGRGLPRLVCDSLARDSGSDGSFVLGPLPAGSYSLSVAHRGHAPAHVAATVAPLRSVDVSDVVLDDGLTIRGRVRDRQGSPVAGVLVHAQPRQGGDDPRAEAETDADGAFSLAGLSAGSYALTAEAAGYARGTATASAGGDAVSIVLDAGATIVGRVVDASGQAVDRAMVSAEMSSDSPLVHAFVQATTGDEGEGRFTIRDAAPGTYALRVVAAAAGRGSLTGVKALAGRTTDVGTIVLGATGTLRGVVVDSDEAGVPGATVQVRPDAHRAYSDDPSAQTDINGAFEVVGVRPGRVDLVVSHPAFVSARLTGIEVDPEKEPKAQRIVLTRGGRIEGRALRRDGRPFDDGQVMIISAAGNAGPPAQPTPTLPDGSFVIEHVPAGRVTASLMTRVAASPMISGPPGMTILTGVASRELEIREGETATLDLATRDIVLAGRVTRGGQPLSRVVVDVTPEQGGAMSGFMTLTPSTMPPSAGPPPMAATTREDGSYELVVFSPGKSLVHVGSADRQSFPSREVDIPDVERYELDLELGAAGVSGIVLDKDSGSPLPDAQVRLSEPGTDGAFKGGALTGADGRFTIAAESGEYVLEASAPPHRQVRLPLTVGSAGLPDVRVEMEAGVEIRGRVVDATGRSVADAAVVAVDTESGIVRRGGLPQPDGSFRITGLDSTPYVVLAGAENAGFALRSGVAPGGDAVTLSLRPGARLLVRILGPDGKPAKDAWPHVSAWDGVPVRNMPGEGLRATEAPGAFEMLVPPGTVELTARQAQASGRSVVQASPDRTTAIEIVLKDTPSR